MNWRRRLDCVSLWLSIAPIAIITWAYVIALMALESMYDAATSRKRLKIKPRLTRASG